MTRLFYYLIIPCILIQLYTIGLQSIINTYRVEEYQVWERRNIVGDGFQRFLDRLD